jgi:uncharacterized protein YjgD (DUF1641 family)
VLGAIDPELLKKLAEAIPDVIASEATVEEAEPPGWWEVLRILRSKNLRRGLAIANNVLEGLGRNFSSQKK